MSWKAGLRRASLGGVQFHTRDRSFKTGRSLHVHEYPKRDEPFTEDMGRDTRKWTVDAYVIGDDYMSRRDALIAVCEREGVQSYTDHWGRSARVRVESCDLKEQSDEGRMCRFSIALVEPGSIGPSMAIAGIGAVLGAASALLGASAQSAAARLVVGQAAAGIARVAGVQQSALPAAILRRSAQSTIGR